MVGLAEGAVREALGQGIFRTPGFRIQTSPCQNHGQSCACGSPQGGQCLRSGSGCGAAGRRRDHRGGTGGRLGACGRTFPEWRNPERARYIASGPACRAEKAKGMLVAPEAGDEAAVVEGLTVYTPRTLGEARLFWPEKRSFCPISAKFPATKRHIAAIFPKYGGRNMPSAP